MKQVIFTFLMLILLTISAFAQKAKQNYVGNKQLPEAFGADVLAGGEVFRGSFAADGRTFYFFKKYSASEEDYRIFAAQLIDGKWQKAEKITLGGEYSDLYPSISKDGKKMVFISYRPAPGDISAKRNAYLWFVEKKGNGWGEPVFISAVNKFGHYHSWAEIGFDGNLYFRQTTPDWKLNQTFVSRWNGKEYTTPVLVEEVERWKNWKSDLRIAGGSFSPDGKALFLDVATTNPQTGKGASDIWVSVKANNQWTEPQPLGAEINSDGYDNFHFFSPDKKDLYFVRDFKTFYKINLKNALESIKSNHQQSKVEAELMQLERDIGEANIKRDKAFFERIEADEFIFTDSGGGLTTKAEDVASLDKPAGEFKLVSYIVDEMKVFDYGKTAVVTGRTTTVSRGKDREITNKSRFTDVFVKRDGRWQLVAGHSSRIREPQK